MFQYKSSLSNNTTESLILRVVIGDFDGSDDVSYDIPQSFLNEVSHVA